MLLTLHHAVYIQMILATMCGRKHKPPHYTTPEDQLNDQRRNQRHRHVDSPSSEIAATRRPVSLSAQDIDVSTISRLVSWA